MTDPREAIETCDIIFKKTRFLAVQIGKLLEYPEIMTQGESLEELEENMREACAMMILGDVPTQHEIKELAINI